MKQSEPRRGGCLQHTLNVVVEHEVVVAVAVEDVHSNVRAEVFKLNHHVWPPSHTRPEDNEAEEDSDE